MSGLSSAQVRTLEAVASATDRGSPFIPPNGPSGRPAKFLKNAELVTERDRVAGGLWITDTGRAALAKARGW